MKLEHGKRYITRCGMITPRLNSRFNGVSFDLPDNIQGYSSGISWHPNGICRTPAESPDDFDIVAEAPKMIQICDQDYRGCKIESAGSFWNWHHQDYDGAPDAGGTDAEGKMLADKRRGSCFTVQECMAEIDNLYED